MSWRDRWQYRRKDKGGAEAAHSFDANHKDVEGLCWKGQIEKNNQLKRIEVLTFMVGGSCSLGTR